MMVVKTVPFLACLATFTSCGTMLIDNSTNSINANSAAIARSTEVIRKNGELIDESTRVIAENKRLLERVSGD